MYTKDGDDMEWIRISSNKLKIMLNAEDAKRYELNCEASDCTDVITRRVFREILTDVRQETDFDTTDDKIYIQMYPSKEGGCELFVTKIGLMLTSDAPTVGERRKRGLPHASPSHRRTQFIRFENFEHLLALCRRLFGKFSGESTAWQDENGSWWLQLTDDGNPLLLCKEFPFLTEYGKQLHGASTLHWLREHARCICPTIAVSVLGQY